jgi:DNA repair protein RadC
MSNIILYTTDENSTTGIREASFQEVLDAARLALAKRVRRGTGFTSPRVTADYLRVRLGTLDHEVFCVIYLTKRHELVEIKVLDHIIIGGGDVMSFAERGLL